VRSHHWLDCASRRQQLDFAARILRRKPRAGTPAHRSGDIGSWFSASSLRALSLERPANCSATFDPGQYPGSLKTPRWALRPIESSFIHGSMTASVPKTRANCAKGQLKMGVDAVYGTLS
jgi:hypothetical protein